MSEAVLATVLERFAEYVVAHHAQAGDETVVIGRDGLVPIVRFLRDDPRMNMNFLVDITAVDKLGYADHDGPRFEVVYHLHSLEHRHRLRIKVPVAEADPVVPSIASLYGVANWHEREAWDMYGVRFDGSPDHRRILLYEGFEGHPLRKDYPQRGYQPLIDLPTLPRWDAELPPLVDEDL
jgi:NADH-quinone oxidoreductase subunit C